MFDIFTKDSTPCGRPIFCTEMSDWNGAGRPDPATGNPCGDIQLRPGKFDQEEEILYWVALAPSGAFMRIFND